MSPTLDQRAVLGRRPARRAVMRQSWRDLVFLHWELDPQMIQDTLPPGLFVDCHHGKAFAAIVPFKMRAIRPHGLPAVPYLSHFLETNVRTYVHDEHGVPGVWFYSLDTDRWVAHWIAKRFFHLPYVWSKMGSKDSVYTCTRGTQTSRCEFEWDGALNEAAPGSLEFFLLERYLLFSHSARKDRIFKGQVHHCPYQFGQLKLRYWDVLPLAWNGLPCPSTAPVHQCYSPGVDVEVFPIERNPRGSRFCSK